MLVNEFVWRVSDKVRTDWEIGDKWIMRIEGDPTFDCEVHARTQIDAKRPTSLTVAMAPLNAIPTVCEAPPGVNSVLDLPVWGGGYLTEISCVTVQPAFTDRFTNHVGYESLRTSATEASSWIECRPDLLDERGNLHPAVIGYLVDSTAGVVCGMAAVPNWVVTADLQFRIVCPTTTGPLRADAVAVRPGRRQSLGEVRVVDEGAAERLVALGTVNHLVIAKDDDLDVPADMPIGVRYGPAEPITSPRRTPGRALRRCAAKRAAVRRSSTSSATR